MNLNFNQLFVFYLAARHKSMAAAATQLYVSRPAVTMQIKKMEEWLGFTVFERVKGNLLLSEHGKNLYAAVEPMFSHFEAVGQYIDNLSQGRDVEIKLGTHHLPGNYFISDLIAHVQTRYPALNVQMELGTQDELLEKLFQHKLDLALIIGAPPTGVKCGVAHLFAEEMALVAAPGGRFGKLDSISVNELANLPIISQQRGTGALREVMNFFRRNNIEPNIMLNNLSSDVIKQFLPKMHAAAFIARFIVQRELDEGILHEIKVLGDSPVSRFNLVYMDRQYLPVKITKFLDGISGFAPKFSRLPLEL